MSNLRHLEQKQAIPSLPPLDEQKDPYFLTYTQIQRSLETTAAKLALLNKQFNEMIAYNEDHYMIVTEEFILRDRIHLKVNQDKVDIETKMQACRKKLVELQDQLKKIADAEEEWYCQYIVKRNKEEKLKRCLIMALENTFIVKDKKDYLAKQKRAYVKAINRVGSLSLKIIESSTKLGDRFELMTCDELTTEINAIFALHNLIQDKSMLHTLDVNLYAAREVFFPHEEDQTIFRVRHVHPDFLQYLSWDEDVRAQHEQSMAIEIQQTLIDHRKKAALQLVNQMPIEAFNQEVTIVTSQVAASLRFVSDERDKIARVKLNIEKANHIRQAAQLVKQELLQLSSSLPTVQQKMRENIQKIDACLAKFQSVHLGDDVVDADHVLQHNADLFEKVQRLKEEVVDYIAREKYSMNKARSQSLFYSPNSPKKIAIETAYRLMVFILSKGDFWNKQRWFGGTDVNFSIGARLRRKKRMPTGTGDMANYHIAHEKQQTRYQLLKQFSLISAKRRNTHGFFFRSEPWGRQKPTRELYPIVEQFKNLDSLQAADIEEINASLKQFIDRYQLDSQQSFQFVGP